VNLHELREQQLRGQQEVSFYSGGAFDLAVRRRTMGSTQRDAHEARRRGARPADADDQLVRQGKPEVLFPELFNDTWRRAIVSNWIDSVAREFAEMIARCPR
jgi:hypothetical protein